MLPVPYKLQNRLKCVKIRPTQPNLVPLEHGLKIIMQVRKNLNHQTKIPTSRILCL